MFDNLYPNVTPAHHRSILANMCAVSEGDKEYVENVVKSILALIPESEHNNVLHALDDLCVHTAFYARYVMVARLLDQNPRT
jgi:hypothetical protein